MTDIVIPTVLAFERKLENSDALMFSGHWSDINDSKTEKWKPIIITERRNRAVKSNFKANTSEETIQEEAEKPNLVWGDEANLPLNLNHDTLKVSWTLRILGNIQTPSTCNVPEFEEAFKEVINSYSSQYKFKKLSELYAQNIMNGRFLWRNKASAEEIKIVVKTKEAGTNIEKELNVVELTKIIQQGLSGESFSFVKIDAFAKLGIGQRVWPSQEMRTNIPKGEKSRWLFQLNNCAAIHSQKIGNAIRTIDTWYQNGEDNNPIAVEPYGSVTHRGRAYRASGNDFKTLQLKWINNKLEENEQHFVIAVLIRGGVFGSKSE